MEDPNCRVRVDRRPSVGNTMRLFPSTEEPFIKLRFDNFKTVTRDQTLPAATQDAHAIRRAAGECLKRVPLERRIRLLGVPDRLRSPLTTPSASAAPSLFG